MSACILDVANGCKVHPALGATGIVGFKVVEGSLEGWAWEDGHTLIIYELWAEGIQHGDRGLEAIIRFLLKCSRVYDRIVLEGPFNERLMVALIRMGWGDCMVFSAQHLDWVLGMSFNRGVNKPLPADARVKVRAFRRTTEVLIGTGKDRGRVR